MPENPSPQPPRRVLSPEEKNALDLFFKKDYAQAYDVFKEVYDTQRAKLGDDHPHTLQTLTSISHCLRSLEKYDESLNVITQAIKCFREKLGPFDTKTRAATKSKCLLLNQTEKFDEAIELLSDLWEYEEPNDIANSIETLSTLVSAYMGKGDFEKAKVKALDLVQIAAGIKGVESRETLGAQALLANILLNSGEEETGTALLGEVLEKQKEILGSLDEDTKRTEEFLAAVKTTQAVPPPEITEAEKEDLEDKRKGIESAIKQNKKAFEVYEEGKYQHAMELLTQSLHKLKKYKPEDKLGILETQHSIAMLLDKVGRPWQGKKQLLEVLKELEEILPPDSEDVLTARSNLAVILCSIGKFSEAYERSSDVLLLAESALGVEHELTLTIKHNIACILIHMAEYDLAKVTAGKVLEARKRVLGDDHKYTQSTLNVIAEMMNVEGDYNRAYDLILDIYDYRKKHLGEKHPVTLSSLHDLSIAAENIGQHGVSFGICLKAVKLLKKSLGMSHPVTLKVQLTMLVFFMQAGYLKKATELGDILFQHMTKVNGFYHPDTIMLRQELGRLNTAKDLNFSYGIFRMNYQNRVYIYGEDHPATVDSKACAVMCYIRLLRQARRHLIY